MQTNTDPRNAAEWIWLTTPTAGMPGLQQRVKALAYMHGQGQTLPDTSTAQQRAAWAAHNAPPPPPPPPLPVYLPAPAPAPAKPKLDEASCKAVENDVLVELESCIGWIRAAGRGTDSLAKIEKATEMASRRAAQAVARWTANSGQPQTARMSELSGLVQKESTALRASRAAAESAQRMAGK